MENTLFNCLHCNQPTTRQDRYCCELCERFANDLVVTGELVTVAQAAALFGVNRSTLRRRIKAGQIKSYRKFGVTLLHRSPAETPSKEIKRARLKALFKRHAISLHKLARVSGISKSAIHRFASGDGNPAYLARHQTAVLNGVRAFLLSKDLSSDQIQAEISSLF